LNGSFGSRIKGDAAEAVDPRTLAERTDDCVGAS
jgi:hypothetical protein